MTSKLEEQHKWFEELIDSMLKDQNDGNSFEDLVSRSEQISKLIKAMSLQILEIESIEAEEKLLNVKKSWKIVQNEIARIDASDFAAGAGFSLQELFLQKSPEAQRALIEAKTEMDRVRQEIEDFFANRT